MPTATPATAPIELGELIDAFEFVSISNLDEHEAYICKATGCIVFVSEDADLETGAAFPDDPDLAGYLSVPHRRDLVPGRRLALSFVADELPGSLNVATEIFSRRGAYSRFKQLLRANGIIDKWYTFEAQSTEAALISWCEDAGVLLSQKGQSA
jgi:hypothetical protein